MEANPQIRYDVFISYARKDGELHAARLERALSNSWRDRRGIDPTDDFAAQIEKAIQASRFVIICVTADVLRHNSFVRREIAYAQLLHKPILVVRFEDVLPPISVINNTWLDFFNQDWQVALHELKDWLIQRNSHSEYAIPPLPQELSDDPYREYAEKVYQDVVEILDQKIIKLIDISSRETHGAVRDTRPPLLAGLMAREGIERREREINSLIQGLHLFKYRLLLLGEPGAGKSIALYALARDALAERLNNPEAPLPVLLNVATWDVSSTETLDAWITKQSGLPETQLKALREAGKLLMLFDGLDELGRSREEETEVGRPKSFYDPRLRFLQHVIPHNNAVILTCRTEEYAELADQAPLNGAITIQPLTDTQIRDYLTDLPDLWEALQTDVGLMEIARTPLLLSFFAFGFRDAPDEARALKDLSKAELGDAIFARYVRERYAHEERRLKAMGEIPPFTLDKIYEVLGHVAMINASGGWRRGKNYQEQIEDNVLLPRDFVEILNDAQSSAFTAFVVRLNLLTHIEKQLGFIHLRLRDHFVRAYCLPRLYDETLYEERETPNPAAALGSLPDNEASDVLLALLEPEQPETLIEGAIHGLKISGRKNKTITDKILYLFDRTPKELIDFRADLLMSLSSFEDPTIVKELIHIAKHNEYGWLRGHSLCAIANLLTQTQIDNYDFVSAVKLMEWVVQFDPDEWAREQASQSLRVMKQFSSVRPLELQYYREIHSQTRYAIIDAIAEIGNDEAIRVLVNIVKTGGENLNNFKNNALQNLQYINSEFSQKEVINLLNYVSYPGFRVDILEYLSKVAKHIKHTDIVPVMLTVLRYDRVAWVRGIAAKTLGNIGDFRAVPALITALRDTEQFLSLGKNRVCDVAVEALEIIGTPEALDAVRRWRIEQDSSNG